MMTLTFCPDLPRVLPYGWRLIASGLDGAKYAHDLAPMAIIISGAVELDGKRWIHASISHAKRLPTYEELRELKDVWIGRDRTALQVFPPIAKHVNIHPNVLHLWCCLDGDVTPDFTHGGGSI